MTKEVASCSPDTNAATAAEIMWKANVGVLPVVETAGRPLGVVTDRDLFIALGTSNRRAPEVPVGEIMKTGLSLCKPEDDVRVALDTMAQQQLHRLPVVDDSGSLKGILSLNDVALCSGSNGLSSNDVAGALKAICGHPQGPKALQRRPPTARPVA
jgi:CBS domain-containing protein